MKTWIVLAVVLTIIGTVMARDGYPDDYAKPVENGMWENVHVLPQPPKN
jgi:hypothetical protein